MSKTYHETCKHCVYSPTAPVHTEAPEPERGASELPEDLCISLYCFHRREYHTPKCVFSGCSCQLFEEAPTDAEAEAILRKQGIDPKQLTNDFIEYLMRRHGKLAQERDALASAIARAAQRAGIYNGEVPLTGPQLIMLCDDLAARVHPAAQPQVTPEQIVYNVAQRDPGFRKHMIEQLSAMGDKQDRGLLREIPPDRFCLTQPDGECVSTDPSCMHQPAAQEDVVDKPNVNGLACLIVNVCQSSVLDTVAAVERLLENSIAINDANIAYERGLAAAQGVDRDSAAEICAEMAREAAMRSAKNRSPSWEDEFSLGAAAQYSAQSDALREAERRIRALSTTPPAPKEK